MFDKELMKQLATISAENRAEWFAERDKLSALAKEMNRLNVDDMVKKYGVARVIRVLAATIKCCPEEYDNSVEFAHRLCEPCVFHVNQSHQELKIRTFSKFVIDILKKQCRLLLPAVD